MVLLFNQFVLFESVANENSGNAETLLELVLDELVSAL